MYVCVLTSVPYELRAPFLSISIGTFLSFRCQPVSVQFSEPKLVAPHLKLWCQTVEEWGNPVYIQSVRKKVPLRNLSLNLASQTWNQHDLTAIVVVSTNPGRLFTNLTTYPPNNWPASDVYILYGRCGLKFVCRRNEKRWRKNNFFITSLLKIWLLMPV